jgi:prephenate dehydrogenase
MTANKHDKLIAFTSQLAHIVSNAYVKSPSSLERKGISAGSYKDLTRVAYLNENMWTELFLDNKDNLIFELDNIIAELQKYSDAMKNNDPETLRQLLKDGKEMKLKAD